MRISDWSSDVCSSDLWIATVGRIRHGCHERCGLLWNVPVGFLLAGSTAVQADHRAHLREHGYVSIAFLWIGTDQCLQSVNDPFGVIEPSEHQCVRVALFIGIGMLCRGERPPERLEQIGRAHVRNPVTYA